jgi:cyanoexosortase B
MASNRSLSTTLDRYLPLGAIVGLWFILYAPLLIHWCDGWLNKTISIEHEYFSHGLIGFPFAAYLCWENRPRWQKLPDVTHWGGLALIVLGIVLYGSNLTDLINLSLPLTLTGIFLWLKGIPGLRLQAFSLALVYLATPNQIPYLIAPYTLPLQKFIAGVAGLVLLQFNIDVRVEQIYLYVNDRIVEVAPYCAGLKMLFTSLYVGLMLVYWSGTWVSRKKTIFFFSSIVVLNVVANIIRNTILTFFHGTGRDRAFAWLHDSWGGDLYSVCLLGLLIVVLLGIERWWPEPAIRVDEPELQLENRIDVDQVD